MQRWQATVNDLALALQKLERTNGDAFSMVYQEVLTAMRAVEYARCAWRDAQQFKRYGLAAATATPATMTPMTELSASLTAELEAIQSAPMSEERILVSPRLQFARWLAQTGRIKG